MQHSASSDINNPVTNTQRMTTVGFCYSYMRQSWVENEHYSIVYLVHITTFKAEVPLKAGLLDALCKFSCFHTGYARGEGRGRRREEGALSVTVLWMQQCDWNTQRNRSLWTATVCGAHKLLNRIMFDFYPGLPHIIFMIGTVAAVLSTSTQTMSTAGFCYSCIIICGLVDRVSW